MEGDTSVKHLVLTAALVLTTSTGFAMGDEVFDQKNPAHVTDAAVGYEVAVQLPETVRALEEVGAALERAHEVHEGLAVRLLNHERLTDRQERFVAHDVNSDFYKKLDKHFTNRVEFFKRAHNWNGDNKYEHTANYQVFLNKDNEAAPEAVNGYSNSYGWNVLRAVRQDALSNVKAVMNRDGEAVRGEDIVKAISDAAETNAVTVSNEELRFYMNELVWYVAKQTAKETHKELNHVLK